MSEEPESIERQMEKLRTVTGILKRATEALVECLDEAIMLIGTLQPDLEETDET